MSPYSVALGDAFELRISQLDDNFDVRLPENEKFKGQPRPELDEAWNGLLKCEPAGITSQTRRMG